MATKAFKTTESVKTEDAGEKPEIIEKTKKFLANEIRARSRWERKAYVNVMMKEGHHWVNDEGISDQRDPNQLRRPVNKFKTVLRGLKNSVTFNDPIVEIAPDNGQSVDQDELDLASAIIRNEFSMAGEEGKGMKDLMRTVVDEAALKTFCVVSVLPNNEEDSPRLNDIRVHDSFDVFFDNHTISKAQIGVISSFEDKEWLESNGFKNVDRALSTEVRSHSALKNEFERQHGDTTESESSRILVDNVYYMEYEENEESEKKKEGKKSKPKVMCATFSGDQVLREPTEVKGYKHLGELFFLYEMEKSEFIKYSTPWMTDVVPLQRSLNDSSENIDTILHWVAKIRFLQRAGAQNTVQVIGDRHVQKVRYEGERPTFMEMPQIPPDLFRQTQMREGQIEDMVGIHAPSMGKSSGDRVSGRKEAVLAAGDADNVAEPVRNLETFLSMIFGQILENAAANMTKAQTIVSQGKTYQAIGEDAYDSLKKRKEDFTPVRAFKNIKIVIVPGSNALIAQGRQEVIQMIQFFLNAGMQDQAEVLFEVLMRNYAMGAARDIMKMVEQKKEEADAENADLAIAKAETDKLARAEIVTATPEQPHELHIQLKMAALNTLIQNGAVKKQEGDVVFETFMQNIGQHQSMLDGGPPEDPVGQLIKGVR